MPDISGRQQLDYVWRFGAGTNTRSSEDEILDDEDAGGVNFGLDLEDRHWKPRMGFAKLATATNTSQINGFAQVHKAGGALSTLIQAGTTVYNWDLSTGFTSVGTVDAGARLRGTLESNWTLGDKVLIADLGLRENIKEWDGATFQDLTTTGVTDLKAKYLFVENERVFAANLSDSLKRLAHMIAVSGRSDETAWTVTDRPTSALGTGDPFQLTTPDLRPVNGLVEAFGTVVFSTREGSMYRFVGETTNDFVILPLYSYSGAVGDEGVVFVGNDVFYGKQGSIQSLSTSESLGDVSADDLTRKIYTSKTRFNVKDTSEWIMTYDRARNLLYAFPKCDDRVWVFYKSIWDETVQQIARRAQAIPTSPWMMWETQNAATFQPTAVWNMLDANKHRQVYFGDANGNIYQMQSGHSDSDSNIKSQRLSRSLQTPKGAAWDVEGHVIYRAATTAATLTLTVEHGGIAVMDQDITINIPAITLGSTYGGSAHYGGTDYYETAFKGRLTRQNWTAAGRSSKIQLRATIEGTGDFSIAEIKLRFKTAPQP